MFSVVSRQAFRSSRQVQVVRRFSAEPEKKLKKFSMVENPIGMGIFLLASTALLGAFMYRFEDELPLPQSPAKESS
jgi:hypothetical protein